MTNANFIGVKIGDVNNSVTPNVVNQSIEFRSDDDILFVFEDKLVAEGDVVSVTLRPSISDIYGYQLELGFRDAELLEVAGVGITEDNYNGNEGRVSISYNGDAELEQGDGIITLTLKITADGVLSDYIKMQSETLRPEAYVTSGLESHDIRLTSNQAADLKLYQNRPNPFSGQTSIDFELPTAGQMKISFYDVTGQLLQSYEEYYEQGFNTITVDQTEIGSVGMVYYKIEFGEQVAIRHMIIIE